MMTPTVTLHLPQYNELVRQAKANVESVRAEVERLRMQFLTAFEHHQRQKGLDPLPAFLTALKSLSVEPKLPEMAEEVVG